MTSAVSSAASAEEPLARLVVLDSPDDGLEGSELRRTLEAYLSEIQVEAVLVETPLPPGGREAEAAFAARVGREQGAIAVLWVGAAVNEEDLYTINLMLLEVASRAVITIPVTVGDRQGARAFRIIAASTRMAIDTDLLESVREVERISREEEPPEPWPAPRKSPPRDLSLHVGYLGALALEGGPLLSGFRAGLFVGLNSWILFGLQLGGLFGAEQAVADLRISERRLPVRLALSLSWPLGPTRGELIGFYGVEPVWVDARSAVGEGDPGAFGRIDSGGGLELRWRFPIFWKLWVHAAVGAELAVVSHRYVRGDEIVVDSSCCRLEWSAGLTLADL